MSDNDSSPATEAPHLRAVPDNEKDPQPPSDTEYLEQLLIGIKEIAPNLEVTRESAVKVLREIKAFIEMQVRERQNAEKRVRTLEELGRLAIKSLSQGL